jgi:transglutaminase-like putative cysteine protease
MRRLQIWHETRYDFAVPVELRDHQLMLRPREGHDVRVQSSKLLITPLPRISWQRDTHDNSVATASFSGSTQQLLITSEVVIQHYDEAPLNFLVSDRALNFPFTYTPDDALDLGPYLQPPTMPRDEALHDWLARFWRPPERVQTYVLLQRLCEGIAAGLTYRVREEPGVQSPSRTLALGNGSCRDFATLFMALARTLGLAARFVSGYLVVPLGDKGSGATHAWAEVYLPGAGWKGFDPTIGRLAGSDHIAVAVARRPEAVPPVAGSFLGPDTASPALQVQVRVTPLSYPNG